MSDEPDCPEKPTIDAEATEAISEIDTLLPPIWNPKIFKQDCKTLRVFLTLSRRITTTCISAWSLV